MGWLWSLFGLGAGPSGFGSSSTAEQVTDGVDASNLTAIVTGATSGVGKETARVLALRGATVIVPARKLEAGFKAKESLLESNPAAKIEVMEMDLSSLASVESFARAFLSSGRPLNILVNNAGVMCCPFQLSHDGIELQFATNHLGHFLLTNLLLEKMKATSRETGVQGRIVVVSSDAHRRADDSWLHLNIINYRSKYWALRAYWRSKLSNILHANELSRRLKVGSSEISNPDVNPAVVFPYFTSTRLQEEGADVVVNSLHPGVILTNIVRHLNPDGLLFSVARRLAKPILRGVPEGAATTCYLALHPGVRDFSGRFFTDCNEATPTRYARDGQLARKLWALSEEALKRST